MIPAILVATIMVAGIFAFMPVEQASTVHDTIIAVLGTPDNVDMEADIDDAQNQVAALIEFGDCSQAASDTDATFTCLTAADSGIAFVTVTTTTDAGGVRIEVGGTATCSDVAILAAASPYTCAIPLAAGDIITLVDPSGDNDVATAQVVLITNQDNPSE